MNTLDSALRTMLHDRAEDITTVPAHLTAPRNAPDVAPAPHRHTTRWLVAASVAAVLALAGAVVAVRSTGTGEDHTAGPGHTARPAASGQHRPTPAPTPVTRSSLLRFDADVRVPAGYTVRERSVQAGLQTFALRRAADHLTKAQSIISRVSVYVTVYEVGHFDPSVLTGRTPTTVDGHPGYFGSARVPGGVPIPGELRTLAWEYAPQGWALVQARTPATEQHAELIRLAAATRTGVTKPFPMPLRIRGSVPAAYTVTAGAIAYDGEFDRIVEIDNHPRTGDATSFTILISSAATDHSLKEPGKTITVDGRTGKLWNNGTNASFRVGSRVVDFNVGGPAYTPTMLGKFLAGVHWSSDPGDPSTWLDGATLLS